ncbi:unnamed protein product, partial [Mesorhabditis belari]|uniref:Uncharacterized protein n=1 Tax=Mesorhabditis belari TaxID=2138241 RepID=A0AAF3ED21_9BILA
MKSLFLFIFVQFVFGNTVKRGDGRGETQSFQLQREVEFDELTTPTTTRKPTTTVDPMVVDFERTATRERAREPKKQTPQGPLIPYNDPNVVEIAPLPDVAPNVIPGREGTNTRFEGNVGKDIPSMGVDDRPSQRVESCYSGFSVVNTETVATGKEECSEITDMCYNATITGPVIGTIGKAGCSTSRCKLANAVNRCMDINYAGYQIHFCCCNTGNLCNSKYTNLNIIETGIEKVKDGLKFVDKILDVIG